MKKEHVDIVLKAILAGMCIGNAALVYLSVENHIIGALLFSFGLLVIVGRGYYLYTGKVGYVVPYKKGYLLTIILTLIGNIIGIAIIANLFKLTGITDVLTLGRNLFALKIEHAWYETLALSIFCGMLMYIAVDSFKVVKEDILKVIILMLAVMVFILAKFEHSIANMLYFFLSNTYTLKGVLYILIMICGNAIGSIALNVLDSRK